MIDRGYSSAWAFCSSTVDSDAEGSRRSRLPEASTIRRAQEGDSSAFERIYRSHCRRIYTLCLRMVGNDTEAEDLTQEAFLLVFRKIATFRGESAFSTWLHRLAVNVVFMHLRKKTLRSVPLEKAGSLNGQGGQAMDVGGPDLSLTGFVDRFHLERAVDQLSPTCKLVFVLHDIQGYKHHEIAGMMDSSVGTSKGRLHRARSKLRQFLVSNQNCLAANHGASG